MARYRHCNQVSCARLASHRVIYSYGESREYCLDHAADELLKCGNVRVTYVEVKDLSGEER